MIDTLFVILDEGVFAYLVLGAVLAGLVRGFSGFGTAMVFIPIAGQVLSPVATLIVLLVMDLIGPLPNIPRAIRDGKLPDLLRLITGALIGAPIGVYFLNLMSADTFSFLGAMFSLDNVVIKEVFSNKLNFLSEYNIQFGEVMKMTNDSSDVMNWIIFGFILTLVFKNSIQKIDNFKLNYKTALFTSIIIVISILSLSGESEFLYFQF